MSYTSNKTKWMIVGSFFLIAIVLAGVYMYKETDKKKNIGTTIISSDEKDTKPSNDTSLKQEQRFIENNPHWIMDKKSGIYLWNPEPQEGESISWEGGYVTDGEYKFADGRGTTVWFKDGQVIQEDDGTFEHGKRHGKMTHLFPGGRVKTSYWEHGQEVDPPSSAENDARKAFQDYHNAITLKDYKKAYNMLSNTQKKRMGDYSSYVSGFKTTINSSVSELHLKSSDGSSFVFDYVLIARDVYSGNKTKTQTFRGVVRMIQINGTWYIGEAESKKIGERIE